MKQCLLGTWENSNPKGEYMQMHYKLGPSFDLSSLIRKASKRERSWSKVEIPKWKTIFQPRGNRTHHLRITSPLPWPLGHRAIVISLQLGTSTPGLHTKQRNLSTWMQGTDAFSENEPSKQNFPISHRTRVLLSKVRHKRSVFVWWEEQLSLVQKQKHTL